MKARDQCRRAQSVGLQINSFVGSILWLRWCARKKLSFAGNLLRQPCIPYQVVQVEDAGLDAGVRLA